MRNTSFVLFMFGLMAGMPFPAAQAAEEKPAPLTAEQAEVQRAKVLELRTQAKSIRKQADAEHADAGATCRRAVLVNNCLHEARDRRLEKIEQARAIELEASTLDKVVRRYDAEQRRALRAKKVAEAAPPATVTVEGVPATTLTAEGLFNAPSSVPPKQPKR